MSTEDTLLKFICIALGEKTNVFSPEDVSWDNLLRLAEKQKVVPIVMDGIVASGITMPHSTRMEWICRVAMCQQGYERHEKLMLRIAQAYHKVGIRMMVLKGWGMSLNYPIPCHRLSGDLDIWNFGKWKEADAFVASKGIKIDGSHHHHSVFHVKGLMVENHYDFINVYGHRSSRKVEKKLKELASKEVEKKEIEGITIYLPSADFNALFLLRHTAGHFASTGMNLRQVLDWGLFMQRYHNNIDWEWYIPFIKELGMYPFGVILNTICTTHLGFPSECFHGHIELQPEVDRVLQDMMCPETTDKEDGSLLTSLRVKPLRWWHNRWKHRLCYSDSLISSFFFSLWAKLLKPSHFIQ